MPPRSPGGFGRSSQPQAPEAPSAEGCSRPIPRQAGACPREEQQCWEEAPPGSAGVPPACYPVACRSVSLRCRSRPPCRRERHVLGRSRVLALLPFAPGGGVGRGCARTCAGGTPALPGGLPSMTLKEIQSNSCLFVFIRGSSLSTPLPSPTNDPAVTLPLENRHAA